MKILGIDPGTINCGYSILEVNNRKIKLIEAGLIKMKSRVLQEQILVSLVPIILSLFF